MKASRLRFLFAASLVLFGYALPLSSQGLFREVDPIRVPRVWTVDDSGGADFTDLPQAVLEASSGDVLLVKPGNYTSFDLSGKGLTILGDGGIPKIIGSVTVSELPRGEDLVLRRLEIEEAGGLGTLLLENNVGTVWIEECFLHSSIPVPTYYFRVVHAESASAVLIRTDVIGALSGFPSTPPASSALFLDGSDAHVWESLLLATAGTTSGHGAGSGATVVNAFLYAAGSTFRGGRGLNGDCNPFSFFCLAPGGPGGPGLDASMSGTTPITLACAFQGGPGGSGVFCVCPMGPSGLPTVGMVAQEPLPLRSYRVTTPVRSGTSYELTADSQPGEFVWSVFAEALEPVYVPNYFGTQVSPLPVTLVFEGVTDATGSLTKTVPIPPLAALTSFERLFAQGLFFDALNNAYLGSPSVLVVVN